MRKLAIAATLLLIGSAAYFPATAKGISIWGCPTKGVEAGCIILKGYDISAARPKPRIGYKEIRVSGETTSRPGICMQGKTLKNITWSYTKKRCPK